MPHSAARDLLLADLNVLRSAAQGYVMAIKLLCDGGDQLSQAGGYSPQDNVDAVRLLVNSAMQAVSVLLTANLVATNLKLTALGTTP